MQPASPNSAATLVARLLAGVLLVAAFVLPATPADATALGITCPGQATIEYDPGLTNQSRTSTITTDYDFGPCLTLPLPLAGPTSGSDGVTISRTTSCTDLTRIFDDVTVSGTIHWNTSAASDYTGTSHSENANGTIQIITEGTVTGGLFAGNSFLRTITLANLDLTGCSTEEGVESIPGAVVLEILPI